MGVIRAAQIRCFLPLPDLILSVIIIIIIIIITRMTRGSGRLKEFRSVFILRFAQIHVDPPCAIDLNLKSAYESES